MATPTQSSTEPSPPFMNGHHDEDEKCSCKESLKTIIPDKLIVSELPRERGWLTEHIHLYNGFWYPPRIIHGLLALHQHFKPHPNDVLLASFPKSGTTWLKALLFTIVNRAKYNGTMHPLLTSNPHDLVPWLEAYASSNPTNPRPNSSLFHTHLAYPTLPQQIYTSSSSSCRIVYVFRDPKDVLVSCWHFLAELRPKHFPPISLQEAFDQFSRGASPFGPFWDHVAGYFKASVQSPDKVLFVSYEDLKRDTVVHVKRVAEFLGRPFTAEEEKQGVVREITDLCSFEKLSSLEVNKNGSHHEETGSVKEIRNNVYFRKGEIGDSKNHLSGKMMEILDQITEEKFKDLGLLV
ncbi:PREDICTED: flavonol 3-sulfotransferase-like [Ipomoea nil]|uniref:flavonol 3-sulfotransferase-like n=1 Tax=Ipomoea nil TaxID=35883 RepID=UPI000900CC34|nr:PREDICTED: flavonol 3-sulfotransferase-like [Ipomoea nil]